MRAFVLILMNNSLCLYDLHESLPSPNRESQSCHQTLPFLAPYADQPDVPGGQKQKGREFRNSPRVKSELCFGHRCKLTFLIDKLQACIVDNAFQLRKSHFV